MVKQIGRPITAGTFALAGEGSRLKIIAHNSKDGPNHLTGHGCPDNGAMEDTRPTVLETVGDDVHATEPHEPPPHLSYETRFNRAVKGLASQRMGVNPSEVGDDKSHGRRITVPPSQERQGTPLDTAKGGGDWRAELERMHRPLRPHRHRGIDAIVEDSLGRGAPSRADHVAAVRTFGAQADRQSRHQAEACEDQKPGRWVQELIVDRESSSTFAECVDGGGEQPQARPCWI